MMLSEEKFTPSASGREKHEMRGNIYGMRDLHGRMANLIFSNTHYSSQCDANQAPRSINLILYSV